MRMPHKIITDVADAIWLDWPDSSLAATGEVTAPDLTPTAFLMQMTTGADFGIAPGPGDIVRQAAHVVRRIAHQLPIVEEDERMIEDLIRRKSRSRAARRPIERR